MPLVPEGFGIAKVFIFLTKKCTMDLLMPHCTADAKLQRHQSIWQIQIRYIIEYKTVPFCTSGLVKAAPLFVWTSQSDHL